MKTKRKKALETERQGEINVKQGGSVVEKDLALTVKGAKIPTPRQRRKNIGKKS